MSSSTAHPQLLQPVDSPLSLRHIPYHFDNEDADKSALDLVEALNEDWRTAEGPVVFVRFTDGITNTLTKAVKKKPGLTESEVDNEAVLIRAYGKGTDVLIDRERELRAHNLLATLNLAPPLLARFDNGLMYRFIQGDVCSPEDLRRPEVYKAVAKRLGQWHGSLPISAITNTPDLVDTPVDDHCAPKDGKQTRPSPNLWTVMQQWIDALPKETEHQRKRHDALQIECAWLSQKLGNTPGLIEGKDYIFGHCDLLSGNVIVEKPSGSGSKFDGQERPVSFIDYEYATPVPAAFDIANHFAEWAGFDCDHSAVPTKNQRIDFLKAYVGSFRCHSINDFDNVILEIDPHNDVAQLNQQVDLFRGVPGLYWGIWALIQAMISQIDFDYASYAEVRLGEYWSWKAEVNGSRAKEGKEMPLRERRWAEE
ncbi:kinase-like protein [Teratosphaeria nubilosa]|uniref:ethanolamine kinase n=1 Tax=Teratosphaeria nubilosa TaxID=161662 RepID=A0A6G1LHK7_9PEZI|nr:kinase-like protein [Teratosphaeria nubilosa]